MTVIRPFKAIRPENKYVKEVAALPYDVFTEEEARALAKDHPMSFICIDRPETQFEPGIDPYDPKVYAAAAALLNREISEGIFLQETAPCFYLYELTMNQKIQTGIVGCASARDYVNNVIKKHEQTRRAKEADRCRHIDVCNAQTGPVFLAYPHSRPIDAIVSEQKQKEPIYDFTADDGVRHRVWIISDRGLMEEIEKAFSKIPSVYIADGHHRAASGVSVCHDRDNDDLMAVFFPDDQLTIYPYYRVVKDLNGMTPEVFLQAVHRHFEISTLPYGYEPKEKGDIHCFVGGQWYLFKCLDAQKTNDPVQNLDISLLHEKIIAPILNITDVRSDERIDFIGGIRGVKAIEQQCAGGFAAGFVTCPVDISELFAVADAGLLMPPKSTWFEPKLRSGIFIHVY